MAIQSSGAISLSELATEFGGTAPHAMSEYYRDAGLVPGNNTNVPTSGAVALTDFYGSVAALVLNVSSNQTAFNILTEVTSAYSYNASTDTTPIIVNVQAGVDIVGSSGNPGITTGALNAASDVTINIAATATVCGFDGAQGANGAINTVGSAGGDGTDAISFSAISSGTATYSVVNSGTIGAGSGGGGGGGGGGSAGARGNQYSDAKGNPYCSGSSYGGNGSTGSPGTSGASCQAQNGTAGSSGTGGSYGGSGACSITVGAGGGQAGGAGGTAGKAVEFGGLSVTVTNNGTVHGATS